MADDRNRHMEHVAAGQGAANIRCAGGGDHEERLYSTTSGKLHVHYAVPCGWEGERTFTPIPFHLPMPDASEPCPHCGGRVEPIPSAQVGG